MMSGEVRPGVTVGHANKANTTSAPQLAQGVRCTQRRMGANPGEVFRAAALADLMEGLERRGEEEDAAGGPASPQHSLYHRLHRPRRHGDNVRGAQRPRARGQRQSAPRRSLRHRTAKPSPAATAGASPWRAPHLRAAAGVRPRQRARGRLCSAGRRQTRAARQARADAQTDMHACLQMMMPAAHRPSPSCATVS
eukprot:scaffold434_cov358-Prasinococcus_capsulatus_cf.AAC.17